MGMRTCNDCGASGMSPSRVKLHNCEEYMARRKEKYRMPTLKEPTRGYYLQGKQSPKNINF